MSRAFVKEREDAVEELPERPISTHPNLVTASGLAFFGVGSAFWGLVLGLIAHHLLAAQRKNAA